VCRLPVVFLLSSCWRGGGAVGRRWSGVQRALAVGQSELQSFMLHHLGRYQQQCNRMHELERRVADLAVRERARACSKDADTAVECTSQAAARRR